MRTHELKAPRAAKRARKRVGRGYGSGHGRTSGRGMKGQNSRAGGGVRPGFEGGQTPVIRRLPSMRGFTNIFKREYVIINLSTVDSFPENSEITPQAFLRARVIKNLKKPIKILGQGELTKPVTVEAHKFSQSARVKIEAAGGKVREIQ